MPKLSKSVSKFPYGIIDSIEDTAIPRGAASRSLNWMTDGSSISVRRGQARLGLTENLGSGRITGYIVAEKADGTKIPFRTRLRKVEYYDATTDEWVEVGTDILPVAASGQDITLSPYQSITGSQLWLNSPNCGPIKIMVANPGSYTSMYDSSKNFKGYIKIKQNRMFLWNRTATGTATDKTGLYGSYVDKDEATDFTQISAEVAGSGNGILTTFTGTLAFKAAGPKRTCFEVTFTDGVETFIDDLNGILVGSAGGTGTINYTTGDFSVTFAVAPAATPSNITATYRWEDSTSSGIADFTKSSPRTAGQGFVFRQDDGGGAFQNLFSINEVEYCFHERKTWALTIGATDTSATNLIFRGRVGMPFFRAGCETGEGIYYVDDIDQNDPHIRLLTFAYASAELVPKSISKSWKINNNMAGVNLADYRFDKASIREWGDFIVTHCRHKDATENNTTFIYNKQSHSVDKLDYTVSESDIYNGALTAGDSISGNVYTLFSGVSDEESDIPNYWEGALDDLNFQRLKRNNEMILEGDIGIDGAFKVSLALDNGPFIEIRSKEDEEQGKHAIEGDGPYVDQAQRVSVGAFTLGRGEVGGGGGGIEAYHYRRTFKPRIPKFERAKIRFELLGAAYGSVSEYVFDDIRLKQHKLPGKYQG